MVVAFTLTQPSSSPRSAAMCATMAGTCGAMRGAWAMIVASTFTGTNPSSRTRPRHAPQELAAVDALVAGVRVGEVPADVAQRRRAQQRVADRVQEHVGVAVAQEALVVRDLDPADHELPARDERVDVESLPDAKGAHRGIPPCRPSTISASGRSSAKVTFRFAVSPCTIRGICPRDSTAWDSSVASLRRASPRRSSS